MTISTLAFGKASAFGKAEPSLVQQIKSLTATRHLSNVVNAGQTNHHVENNGRPTKALDEQLTQRELFMDVLSANATRRDAKQYLARFKPAKSKSQVVSKGLADRNARHRQDQERLDRLGVNLGGLYAPSRAIAAAAQFVRDDRAQQTEVAMQQSIMHVALVCLRAPEVLDAATLDGLATTLSQLVKLDMRIAIVLDIAGTSTELSLREQRSQYAVQAERLLQAIRHHSPEASHFVTGALTVSDHTDSKIEVLVPDLIMEPLKRSTIPIIPPLAYTATGQLKKVDVGSVMVALTRMLSISSKDQQPKSSKSTTLTELGRIIVLDPAGGVPSKRRSDDAHVFINLEQEYEPIQKELSLYASWDDTVSRPNMFDQHQANLRMLKDCLAILPAASSGLVISPQDAASSSQTTRTQATTIDTGTRRQKNTLIHNLLTNKPMVSSSLPTARLSSVTDSSQTIAAATATLVKRGMPVTIIPAPHPQHGWQVPLNGTTGLDLQNDPRISFPRLLHLIEDSFRRKLDVEHYMSRIRDRTAGIIIAGDYEGAAILTWETPPPNTSSQPSPPVPYLDKFAVLQSSQGSSGVADILFQSMVRSCFPRGVCWRSRQDNPVNKWYFERAAGSWKVPGSGWTMFWTGEGVVEDEVKWAGYEGVCRGVGPSWAEGARLD
ncbi:Amino-acid acetyltransferase, mitochondrial [Recurvomyces mirabilis]|uniref:Amino-acid acetyltransferase, mitochondrial n=1 Tax=Recurvomyces mirabilis TaxID=574656 RepID=A0AAE1C562_9PEZI|nr:Amino-acid acetyltransferase, mitochondrial [Recurvomyces mirabilis]KAK5150220.1 Amino-acid acetyltransferase, mitochondrial [Recurvomyces mirabilis]